ncbi:transcription termination/antitermination protein NusG [Atopobacter sp. AH10]|uniref:transcription termination/antitermination protein NusG n=1 Tax=Atopobacter sp. AH10 TaxID=2315861 RepID=UPI000EF21277|nr:transcription termination/antitermination protein NusG [Atopobacter sp. AH10]RLK62793.1 transcription termination/antitermination protein NusG [Atopobacter sp. AH10]
METIETGKEWYVLHTYSGYENKVKENLLLRKNSMGMENNIFDVIVPEEEEVEIKDGKAKTKVQNTFPGYVLVQMIMSDEAWFVVRNTPGVTGFVGSHGAGSKPAPLLDEEIEVILRRMGKETPKIELDIEVGDYVTITDGAFTGMSGRVEAKNDEKQSLRVTVEMFGRETTAEIEYFQVKKEDL